LIQRKALCLGLRQAHGMNAPIPASYSLANLPRYTSYPTAPHFGPLAEAEYRHWLASIGPADRLSLYVHIPFCNALCWYCGCHTTVTRNAARIARYGAALRQEAAALAGALPPHAGVAALHLGGGTPSTLGADGLRMLFAALRASFPFRPDAEIAVELDPRLLDQDIATALAEAGVTRASLGVQDIAAAVQQKIGRPQSEDCVAAAVALLRGAGVGGINLDLMYGLPGQTRAHVAASARFATALRADRVAVFGYAHVPWMKPQQKAIDTAELPGAVERLRQAEVAEETLAAAGYQAIGLDHYARPDDPMAVAARAGRLHRNFQGYTTDDAPVLLGLGTSAIGAVTTTAGPSGYAQNEPDERRYVAAVECGELPVRRGRALTAEDRLRRDCIEQVMCGFALELDRLPPALLAEAWPRLQALAADGILRLGAGRLRVTQAGERHARHVAACFDAYLGQGTGRHSAAV
jgi:oxygen-independent coproporphyrinogen-3 oxidase